MNGGFALSEKKLPLSRSHVMSRRHAIVRPDSDTTRHGGGFPSDRSLYRACVYPLAIFLAFTLLHALAEGRFGWDHPEAAWWQRMPSLWIYPLQTVACGAWLWHVRHEMKWDWALRPCLLGVCFGIAGIALWLIPYFAGWVPREGGFEPERVLGSGSMAMIVEYAFRFARAAVVVPFAEELFWRGFLMRWCVDRDFPQNVPVGRHNWFAYIATTLLFMLAHNPVDYAGALVFGTLAYILVVRTKRISPAIAMHASANLVMGVCAIVFNLPQLW